MKAIWNLGFRPFFLLGSVWGVLQIAIWVIFQAGWLPSIPYHDPVVWHVHEMIFGFATAIMAGFVLTASQNWSGKPGVQGSNLILLVVLWSSARILSIIWEAQPLLFAITDLAFFPLLAYFLKPYLWQESQKRNKIFFLLFLVLAGTNLTIHLNALGFTNLETRPALFGCVFIFIIMISLIGGRVIPFFTTNVIANAKPAQNMWIEKLHLISLAITAASGDVLGVFHHHCSCGTPNRHYSKYSIFFMATLEINKGSDSAHSIFRLHLDSNWTFFKSLRVHGVDFIKSFHSRIYFRSDWNHDLWNDHPCLPRTYWKKNSRNIHHYIGLRIHLRFIRDSCIWAFGFPEHNLSLLKFQDGCGLGAFTIFTIVYAPILCKPREDGKPG
jgi:hypothetical protein